MKNAHYLLFKFRSNHVMSFFFIEAVKWPALLNDHIKLL